MIDHLTHLVIQDEETELANLVTTMKQLVEHYEKIGQIEIKELREFLAALDKLEGVCTRLLPHRIYLEEIKDRGLTRIEFQTLMVNTIIRVAPSYYEIPINVASAAVHGNLQSYAIITNNANDEAGHGKPEYTHPAMLNQTIEVLSKIFQVKPITFKTTLAAFALKVNEVSWNESSDEFHNLNNAIEIARMHVEVDEYNNPRTKAEIEEQVVTALEYADLIAPASITYYKDRLLKLTQAFAAQGSLFIMPEKARQGDLDLAAQLAIREASTANLGSFIEVFNREVADRYLGYVENNLQAVMHGRWWSDIHIDSDFGILYGYAERYIEEDHAEQALRSLVERIRNSDDLLNVLQTMKRYMDIHLALWEGTVEEMAKRAIPSQAIPPKPISQKITTQAKKIMINGYKVVPQNVSL